MQNTLTETKWIETAPVSAFEENGGQAVLIEGKQIAVFYFKDENEWYATDNMCPHQKQQALARGLVGTDGEEPKVACPFHKRSFSLKTGKCLSGDDYEVNTYPVKVENDTVYVGIEA